jgi:hypothetical protein
MEKVTGEAAAKFPERRLSPHHTGGERLLIPYQAADSLEIRRTLIFLSKIFLQGCLGVKPELNIFFSVQ